MRKWSRETKWWLFGTWKNDGREPCSITQPKSTQNPRLCWYALGWLRYRGWTRTCCKTVPKSWKSTTVCWYRLRRWRSSKNVSRARAQKPAKPAKKLSASGRTPVTSCTYSLTSGKRKDKQCRLRASDETGKFCNYHKRQTWDCPM